MPNEKITFYFSPPENIATEFLDQIQELIKGGGGVGRAWVRENLLNAFLIGYALDERGRVIGTVTLKRPKKKYRKKIESVTCLDLSGYLERGYTAVTTGFQHLRIADRLIKGLIERSKNRKIYTTIRMDNRAALKLTTKNGMALAAKFHNDRTGHAIGVFTN